MSSSTAIAPCAGGAHRDPPTAAASNAALPPVSTPRAVPGTTVVPAVHDETPSNSSARNRFWASGSSTKSDVPGIGPNTVGCPTAFNSACSTVTSDEPTKTRDGSSFHGTRSVIRRHPYPPRTHTTAATSDVHAVTNSAARASSEPARYRRDHGSTTGVVTSRPHDRSTATPASTFAGTAGPAGDTSATRSPADNNLTGEVPAPQRPAARTRTPGRRTTTRPPGPS